MRLSPFSRSPRFEEIHAVDQVAPHVRREFEHFFEIYKELEGKRTKLGGWGGPQQAREAIVKSRKAYLAANARE